MKTRSGEVLFPDPSSASSIPQYLQGAGAGSGQIHIRGSPQECVSASPKSPGENKNINASDRAWIGVVNNDAQVPIAPQTEPREDTTLVFDGAVGDWGKKITEPPTPGEAQNLLSALGCPPPSGQSDGCHDKLRDAHMTVTIEDKEEIRLNKLRAEREREKQMEEQELRERNKKKPPLRLLSLGIFGTLLAAGSSD